MRVQYLVASEEDKSLVSIVKLAVPFEGEDCLNRYSYEGKEYRPRIHGVSGEAYFTQMTGNDEILELDHSLVGIAVAINLDYTVFQLLIEGCFIPELPEKTLKSITLVDFQDIFYSVLTSQYDDLLSIVEGRTPDLLFYSRRQPGLQSRSIWVFCNPKYPQLIVPLKRKNFFYQKDSGLLIGMGSCKRGKPAFYGDLKRWSPGVEFKPTREMGDIPGMLEEVQLCQKLSRSLAQAGLFALGEGIKYFNPSTEEENKPKNMASLHNKSCSPVFFSINHGVSLLEFLARKKSKHALTPELRFHLVHSLLREVNDLHTEGYCHNDIKLQNILVDDGNVLRLCDFGGVAPIDSPLKFGFYTHGYESPEARRLFFSSEKLNFSNEYKEWLDFLKTYFRINDDRPGQPPTYSKLLCEKKSSEDISLLDLPFCSSQRALQATVAQDMWAVGVCLYQIDYNYLFRNESFEMIGEDPLLSQLLTLQPKDRLTAAEALEVLECYADESSSDEDLLEEHLAGLVVGLR